MNIFDIYLDKILILIKKLNNEGTLVLPKNLNSISVDIPPSNFDCDISTNVAMVLSKINKKAPIDIAKTLVDLIKSVDDEIETISVVKPGFINIKFKSVYWNNFIKSINQNHIDFGVNTKEKKRKYCRGAILGDVISNLLIFNKHDVSKEYYVNDYGNQIINFTKSVYYRAREIIYNEKFPIENSELYPGDYLIDIAKNIISTNKKLKFDKFEDISKKLTLLSVAESLKLIKSNLSNLGITHDKFTSETEIVFNKEVEKVIEKLKEKNLVYQGKIKAPKSENDENWIEREQLLFKATDFGDDKDRALQKSDKSWTYFASDVAYHNNKLNRGHDVLINILGADHAGYIKRITSVVEALSGDKNKLICKVSQLVKLIKEGKPFKMSKRKGDYITVEDLISEVGKDATRFIMLNRSSDVELDFDFAKVKEKSKDNPLYYVQYCFARISSVFRHVDLDINKNLNISEYDFKYSNDEIKILKKIAEWPKCIEVASLRLEPHRIPVYLYELSSEFHSYWNMGKDDPGKRFINDQKKITNDKLVFLKVISNVIQSGMNIVGVDTPEKM